LQGVNFRVWHEATLPTRMRQEQEFCMTCRQLTIDMSDSVQD
jgi:hypothetical protein